MYPLARSLTVRACALAVLCGASATLLAAEPLVIGPLEVKITYSDKTRGIVSKTEPAELFELTYESIKYRMVKDPKSTQLLFSEDAGKGIEKIESINPKQTWTFDTSLK